MHRTIGRRTTDSIHRAAASIVEKLEGRRLLSVSGPDNAGIVTVDDGTEVNARTIVVTLNTGTGKYDIDDDGVVTSIATAGVDSIQITTNPNITLNDFVEIDATFPNTNQDNGISTFAGDDTVLGSPGVDVVFGGDGNDSIAGRAGADNLNGEGGDDAIRGGKGHDIISGDVGDDLIFGGKAGDQINGAEGNDTIYGAKGLDTLNGSDGFDLIFGGNGDDQITGGAQGDTIIGAGADDSIRGGLGHDLIAGDKEGRFDVQGITPPDGVVGNDTLVGGSGNDTLLGVTGTDEFNGGTGVDAITYSNTADILDTVQGDTPDIVTPYRVVGGSPQVNFTASLAINISGNAGIIPQGSGSSPYGTSIAETTDANGTIQFLADTGGTVYTLNDFFLQWGVKFDANQIGRFRAVYGATISMTVNGSPNTDFQNYLVQPGDQIVITYA